MGKQERIRIGMEKGFLVCVLILTILALTSCAAHKPINKAKIAQDLFIRTLEVTAYNMPAIEKQFPNKVKEVKRVYMQLKAAVQVYQDALRFWETTGNKPMNYEKLLSEMFTALKDLKPLLTSVGVEVKNE